MERSSVQSNLTILMSARLLRTPYASSAPRLNPIMHMLRAASCIIDTC